MEDDDEQPGMIVHSDDAIAWVTQLAQEDPEELTLRLLKAEPTAFGIGANVAKRTCEHLQRQGVSEALIAFVFSQICYAGAMTIEIMRLGSAKLFDEYIAEQEQEGDDRE